MTGTLAAPGTSAATDDTRRGVEATSRWWIPAWWVATIACSALMLVWLALGAWVALAANVPAVGGAVAASADAGNRWAVGVVEAGALGEPVGQAVLDYLASAANLVVAVVLWRRGGRTWTIRLLILAMIGSAGAFNLQAHAATLVVRRGSGLEIGELHQILLHGVASAAYVGALLLFPAGVVVARGGQRLLIGLAGVALFVAGMGTALLPHTVSCVVFFGFGVPLVGALGVSRHLRTGSSPERRDQARLLITVLTGVLATATVLALVTAVMALLGQPGLTLDDPTARHGGAGGEPTALLFWFARLSAAALALAVLAAYRPWVRSASDRLHRALTTVVVVVVVGGAVALVVAVAGVGPVAWVLGAVAGALVYLAVSARADRLVERLLHGRRPTPYRVLLEIAELSRTAAPGTELDRLPEAIGRHLGARTVELTAHRPGLRDRVFRWRREDAGEAVASVAFPVRHREDEVGVLAVDAEAVAGGSERHQLLEDVADSLGAVLQAHRVEIELERQLRAAVAHGEQIATSRRAAVAEMDGQRRAIERNLHDGAQHHLVSLRLALGLAEHQVGSGQLDAARDRLEQIVGQIDTAEAVLAETATGVSSATLAERGVVETLRHETAGPGSTVTVDSAGVPSGRRWGTDVESAVYFCCLEAVNNARKHAPGAAITITFAEVGGVLRFSVRDDGPGFTPAPPGSGPNRGMRNVATRITAVGGTVALESAPGRGTTVAGSIPLADAPAPDPAAPDPPTGPITLPEVASQRRSEGRPGCVRRRRGRPRSRGVRVPRRGARDDRRARRAGAGRGAGAGDRGRARRAGGPGLAAPARLPARPPRARRARGAGTPGHRPVGPGRGACSTRWSGPGWRGRARSPSPISPTPCAEVRWCCPRASSAPRNVSPAAPARPRRRGWGWRTTRLPTRSAAPPRSSSPPGATGPATPASTRTVREASLVLAGVCEAVLADTAPATSAPD